MGLFKRRNKAVNRDVGTEDSGNTYLGLRSMALNMKASDIGISLDNNRQVYGAVVDIGMGKDVATLRCVFDGTVSLYYSSGGGLIGLGESDEAVRDAGGSLLISAGQTLDFLEITQDFSLPEPNMYNVYLLAMEGVYKAVYNADKIDDAPQEIVFLNFLIQNVLTAIRESDSTPS